jgi:hypothetical protein
MTLTTLWKDEATAYVLNDYANPSNGTGRFGRPLHDAIWDFSVRQ